MRFEFIGEIGDGVEGGGIFGAEGEVWFGVGFDVGFRENPRGIFRRVIITSLSRCL